MTSCTDDTLLLDLTPQGSKICSNSGDSASTFDFSAINTPISGWILTNAQLEAEKFLVDMINKGANSNYTQSFRVRKGVNIYSFISAYGKTALVHYHHHQAW